MAVKVWDGIVGALAQTSEFSAATFAWIEAPDIPDWSTSGEFVEIDCQVLVKLGGLWRLAIGVSSQLTTRDVLSIPRELVYSTLKIVLLGDDSQPVNLKVWIEQDTIVIGNPVDPTQKYEFSPTNGQVDFVLPNWTLIDQADSTFYVNGVLQDDEADYVWGDGKITWIGSFALASTDQVTIFVVLL